MFFYAASDHFELHNISVII